MQKLVKTNRHKEVMNFPLCPKFGIQTAGKKVSQRVKNKSNSGKLQREPETVKRQKSDETGKGINERM